MRDNRTFPRIAVRRALRLGLAALVAAAGSCAEDTAATAETAVI